MSESEPDYELSQIGKEHEDEIQELVVQEAITAYKPIKS